MQQIELLAPAKDLECGVAAIDCGADAVYIGASRFGARESAGNELSEIAALVAHAHKYWAKVYATVNTLLRDDELSQALRLISELHEIGVDGLIIQDVGLLECELPPLPLIASTQMHNATPEKVAFLEQVGFGRAILARELDIEQIRAIRERTRLELEVFIHGALCVGYSGQCALSYALGGRSGNRGQCAQPCRKPYTLVDGKGKVLESNRHLLSLRDLSLSEHLRELVGAGVSSFKIEGRLKDKAYVSNVVAFYRARLDEIIAEEGLSRSSSGDSRVDFEPDLVKTFHRGYSTYFLRGRGEPIGALETPKMVGELIGTVASVVGRRVTLDTQVTLHNGDGICFFDRRGELRGTTVNEAHGPVAIVTKAGGIEAGLRVFRNHDHEFLSRLSKSRPERRIAVDFALRESADGFVLAAVDEDENAAEFALSCEKTPAEKPERALESIHSQLPKTGGTDFQCEKLSVELSEPWFVPISTLNALRRGALDALIAARARNRPIAPGGAIRNDFPFPEKRLSFLGNVLNRQAEAFYRRHGVAEIEPAAETGLDLRGRKVMTTRYCLKHQLGLCPKTPGAPKPAEPLTLIDAEGHRLELRFDCGRCEMGVYLGSRGTEEQGSTSTCSRGSRGQREGVEALPYVRGAVVVVVPS